MIKYRPVRGGLKEAMSEMKEFSDIADMIKYIKEKQVVTNLSIGESAGPDDRIGWKNSRMILGTLDYPDYYLPIPIGYCDLGEEE